MGDLRKGTVEVTTKMLSCNLTIGKNEKSMFLLSVLSLNSQFYRDRIREVRNAYSTRIRLNAQE